MKLCENHSRRAGRIGTPGAVEVYDGRRDAGLVLGGLAPIVVAAPQVAERS